MSRRPDQLFQRSDSGVVAGDPRMDDLKCWNCGKNRRTRKLERATNPLDREKSAERYSAVTVGGDGWV